MKLFSNSQYGFRSGHSTEYAAIDLVDNIITQMDNNEIPISIFLDLSKAFDTIDHAILLHKLQHYGIDGIHLQLFKSYLSNIKQYVEIDDIKSNTLPITTGVPKGSILGPLLFIIYINDFPQSSQMFNFTSYADETTLLSTLGNFDNGENLNDVNTLINRELSKVNEWLEINKLSLNVAKCKYMIFHMHNKQINVPAPTINSMPIKKVDEFNFIGLTLDTHLNWKKHSEKISNKCSRITGILNTLKYVLPVRIKLILYNTLLLPHINYCLMTWGFQHHRISLIQKKAIRIITVSKYNAHTSPLFKQLSLLTVKDMHSLQELKFYYKYLHASLPANLRHWKLTINNTIHSHLTRRHNSIWIARTNHVFAERCLRNNLPKTISNTPNNVKEKLFTHSLHGFASYAKNHFISNYVTRCTGLDCYICAGAQGQ